MTDGQYLTIVMISAAVVLVILRFLKRRLLQNEPPGKPYEEMADIESPPTVTSGNI
jgi:hypothetical protein